MTRKVADDVSTSDVVWAAANRIGKASNAQDVNRICDYLVSKQWFQTAGDLRVARENAQEWHALEVPGRLKIAIQEELDASLEGSHSPGKVLLQDRPTASPQEAFEALGRSPCVEAVDMSAIQTAFYDQESSYATLSADTNTVAADLYANPIATLYESSEATDYDRAYSADDKAAAAAHAAAWEAYYAANGYYSNGTPEATGDSWDYRSYPSDDVVEAQEIVIEDAIVVDTELLTNCMESSTLDESSDAVAGPPVETWSCGQCTFLNRIDVSFCEVCCGHISLSPNSQLPTTPTESLVSSDTLVLPESFSPKAEVTESLNVSDTIPPVHTKPTAPERLDIPLYVTIPSPSKPLSPLYSPSAPDFEDPSTDEVYAVTSKALIAGLSITDEKVAEISAPTPNPNAAASSSPLKVDYRALAFKRTPSLPSSTMPTVTALITSSPLRSARTAESNF